MNQPRQSGTISGRDTCPSRKWYLIFLLLLWAQPLFAGQEFTLAAHIHSSMSSGNRSIAEIAALAKSQKIDILVLTDLLIERYEYGVRPFRSFLKKTAERKSVLKSGLENYWKQIREANRQVPEVLTLEGVVATPFYYWSGSLRERRLLLNNRAKDLLVFGLERPEDYKNLPVTGNGLGRSAYEGNQFSKPYQELIDYVHQKGGAVFWSHPNASENIQMTAPFLGVHVQSMTPPYAEDLVSTSGYEGFGVYGDELTGVVNPENLGISAPGGLWDTLLSQYCRGKRGAPVWAIGETDYDGFEEGNHDLSAVLNVLTLKEKSRKNVLEALRNGAFYVVLPNRSGRRLVLESFEVKNPRAPVVSWSVAFSDGARETVKLLLIRGGEVVQEIEQETPFWGRFQEENPPPAKSYYRLIVALESASDRLVSNPIFVSPHE